jgi:hypothetical protein
LHHPPEVCCAWQSLLRASCCLFCPGLAAFSLTFLDFLSERKGTVTSANEARSVPEKVKFM